jgi:DMSO/TMAO reductase YedYZ molybdopterin-dependent catalytic subunit
VSAQVLPGYGVGVASSVGGVTLMVESVGAGVAVVGAGAGDEVVGAGTGAGLLVVLAGAGEIAADVGAAVEALGLADDFTEPRVAADALAAAAGPQDTLYAAGLDAVTAGLVTTITTSPVAGTHAGNVSASAACVPPEAKIAVSGLVRSPSDIAQ